MGFNGPTRLFMHSYFDSIYVVTSSGMAKLRLDYVKDSTSLLVVTSDSLTMPLSVNPEGDCIKIYSYLPGFTSGHFYVVDSLAFGNSAGSSFDSIPAGYSICRINGIFCLDKYPSIGSANDTSGCCATLTGFLFDKDRKKIIGGTFALNYPITFNADGTYSTRILARKYALSYVVQVTNAGDYWIGADALDINAYPDSVINADIHLADPLGINETTVPSTPRLYIINYPNPFNPSTNFYVRIPADLRRKQGEIEIYNSIGQKIYVIPISSASSYRWDGIDITGRRVSSGVYYYRLVLDNQARKTGSMILLK